MLSDISNISWVNQSDLPNPKMVQIVPASHRCSSQRESSLVSLKSWFIIRGRVITYSCWCQGFEKLKWRVQFKRYGRMLWRWPRCRHSKRISLFLVRRRPISEGTRDWIYTRCQVIRFNTWNVNVLSMFLKYKISIHYIYWCVNINIYICTLIHGHVSETFRALFRGFGPQNGLFWPMTRSCLVKLLSFTKLKNPKRQNPLQSSKGTMKIYGFFCGATHRKPQKMLAFLWWEN